MRFNVIDFAKEVTQYKKKEPSLARTYVSRHGDSLVVYFFIKSVEDFPSDVYSFEKKLASKFTDFDFDVKVIPYEEESVNKFAVSRGLIPAD